MNFNSYPGTFPRALDIDNIDEVLKDKPGYYTGDSDEYHSIPGLVGYDGK